MKKELLAGDKINRLTIIKEAALRKSQNGNVYRYFLCMCECGREKEIMMRSLISGRTFSCGCRQKEITSAGAFAKRHGLSHLKLFSVWRKMMARCYDVDHQGYKDYGGRGILVCEDWENPKNFVDWCSKNGWSSELQIDRINNDGNYEPSNCRFSTPSEQLYNRRNNIFVTYRGEKCHLLPLLRLLGIESKYSYIRKKIKNGHNIEQVFKKIKKDGFTDKIEY